jgi:Flp pilus assembly protein CpaB
LTARIPLLVGVGLLLAALLVTTAVLGARSPQLDTTSRLSLTTVALSARVPSGQVATALRVSRSEGVAGVLRPGDTIDVLAAFAARVTGGATVTRVLMREKLVYAVALDSNTLSVTLVMPSEEAILLQDALQVGARPYLVLRSSAGLAGNEAPPVFGNEGLSAWITRLAAGQ